jgi:CheY-like chemotaxis protein
MSLSLPKLESGVEDELDHTLVSSLDRLERAAANALDPLPRARLALRIGATQARLGRRREAVRWLEEGARTLLGEGLRRRAESAIERILALAPCEPGRLRSLGVTALENGLPLAGVRLTVEAARTHYLCDDAEGAVAVLSALDAKLHLFSLDALKHVAEAWCFVGHGARGAALLAEEAERLRRAGLAELACELCRASAGAGAPIRILHRTWGLALLERDDAPRARAHLESWLHGEPESVAAHVWWAEALWTLGLEGATRRVLSSLARRRGVGSPDADGVERLRLEIASAVADEPGLAEARLAPFWEAEELLAVAIDDAEPARNGRPGAWHGPRVFLADDTHVFRLRLSQILRAGGFDVTVKPRDLELVEALRRAPRPDLLILPVSGADPETLDAIRVVRSEGLAASAPILAFTHLDRSGLDLDELRAIGVAGLIDKGCTPEHIAFRANQLVRSPRERRRHVRAPAFFPVDLHASGEVTAEYGLGLSVGGMRVTSSRPLEPNTDVRLRFQLPASGEELVSAGARVIYRRERSGAPVPYELGVFFYPLDAWTRDRIEAEVERLLRSELVQPPPESAAAAQ